MAPIPQHGIFNLDISMLKIGLCNLDGTMLYLPMFGILNISMDSMLSYFVVKLPYQDAL